MADVKVHFLQNNMTDGVEHLKGSVGDVPEDVATKNLYVNGIAEPLASWQAKLEAEAKIKKAQQEAAAALAKALAPKPAAAEHEGDTPDEKTAAEKKAGKSTK